ncbi:MAG: NTP transferase domain-containing protein [Patescibacteria group bacterium]
MANIIPMAGLGSRFADQGYLLPKPLISVSGKPMILRVIERLPPSDKWIFLVRKEHVDQFGIDRLIQSVIPHAIIVPIEKTTEGQASTCMLAMPFVDQEEELLIAACDNAFLYNHEKFKDLKNNSTIDAVVWTFTRDSLLTEYPKSWGWISPDTDGMTIKDVSVKVPISQDPFNDHAIVATFYFKRAEDFQDTYDLMVKENHRINNEFYVDAMPIFLKRLNKRSVLFDVDLYVGWGKPKDLYLYEQKEYFSHHPLKNEVDPLWKKYFDSLI